MRSSSDPFFAPDAQYSAWLNFCVQALLRNWIKRGGFSVVKSPQYRQRANWNEAWRLAVAPLRELEQCSDSCELSAAFFAVIRAIPPELKARPLAGRWFQEQALSSNRWAVRCAAIEELMVRRNNWPLTISILLRCVEADPHPVVRLAAIFALVRRRKDDPETLPILKAWARSDASLACTPGCRARTGPRMERRPGGSEALALMHALVRFAHIVAGSTFSPAETYPHTLVQLSDVATQDQGDLVGLADKALVVSAKVALHDPTLSELQMPAVSCTDSDHDPGRFRGFENHHYMIAVDLLKVGIHKVITPR